MTTNITELAQSLRRRAASANEFGEGLFFIKADDVLALVEALEKAQQRIDSQREYYDGVIADGGKRIAELESRTVKLPDGWQFEECEIEGCENGAIFSVGTGSRNIHLCDKCAHEPQNSRLKKSPLSKRLPFKMSAGIKVEAE
ncbi:TPA: hypothetical protein MH604_07330 [Klebsiella pneumoniae]|nr:hypothetical protein [Klebsiella pneumoniae]